MISNDIHLKVYNVIDQVYYNFNSPIAKINTEIME